MRLLAPPIRSKQTWAGGLSLNLRAQLREANYPLAALLGAWGVFKSIWGAPLPRPIPLQDVSMGQGTDLPRLP